MENENITNNNTTPQDNYIETIQKLKDNTVSKEEYDTLLSDNKKLLDAIVSGQTSAINQPKEEPEKVDIQALRNELYGGRYEGTDLDYMTKVLKLRKAIMDTGAPDPAVCNGVKTTATEADYENCDRVCNRLQEIVDYANGDPAVFRNEFMRVVNLPNK